MEIDTKAWVIKIGAGYIGDRKNTSSVPYKYKENHGWGDRVLFVKPLKKAGKYSKEQAEELAGFFGGVARECPQ